MVLGVINGIIDTFVAMAPYLLIGLFFAGILHVFVKNDLIIRHLGGNSFLSVFKAAIFGIPLPLCSCGVLPVAMSLRKGHASNGATISFLISTPQTGIDGIIATWGMLGPVFAIFRPIAALVMGIVGGLVTNLVSKNKDAEETKAPAAPAKYECNICYETIPHTHSLGKKVQRIFTYAFRDFFDDISTNLTIGIVISGIIAFIVPDNFFEHYVGNEFLSMLLMIALGIPMYTCVTASIPVAMVLMLKGLSPGAAFVFLTVGPATNVAFITVIMQVMGKKIVGVYLASLAVMSILSGYVLNFIFGITGKQSYETLLSCHFHGRVPLWQTVLSGVFLVVLLLSFYRLLKPRVQKLFGAKDVVTDTCCVIDIEGMSCKSCALKVSTSLEKVEGVTSVDVDVKGKKAIVKGPADKGALEKAIEDAGYKIKKG
jgi:uncharacterized membrane protein YraQ (UPF0718 family)/copper chaperone CopZ